MSDDLISRQAAIALADEYQSEDAWEIRDRIAHEMPSVGSIPESEFGIFLDAVPNSDVQEMKRGAIILSGAYDTLMGTVREWIPCSERMPEEEGAYLVTEVSYGELYVSKGYYVQENGERIWRNDTYEYDIIDPIAWMELPEPYREDKE